MDNNFSKLPEIQMELITNKGQLDAPDIAGKIVNVLRSENVRRMYFYGQRDFNLGPDENTSSREFYVVRSNYGGPVGIINPTFNHTTRTITSIRPIIFDGHQGKGYGSSIFKWAFKEYKRRGFNRIACSVVSYNEPSLAVCRKFFKDEVVFREDIFIDGEFHDIHYFLILCREIEF